MWERTKRLINSYLDNLIEKASSPDRDVRAVTRAEIARLGELEVQARASVKMFEKELAEVELKMIGVSERERMAREQGDDAKASSATSELVALSKHRDLLKQQISEASSSAARARSLREQRQRLGEDLATETHLTSMRENLAGIQSSFDATDPAGTIDEMRARIGQHSVPTTESRVSDADRELEAERARAAVDELLARYKGGISSSDQSVSAEARKPQPAPTPESTGSTPVSDKDEEDPDQPKTLGRSEGPVRPID